MTLPTNEHEQKLTLSVDIFIPDHPDRANTPVFDASRRKLISENPSACCEVCGATQELELHHNHVEWCDSDGVDWGKVRADVPDFDWATFDPTKPEMFIDSIFNANRVLCKKHHTGKDHGIHMMPLPTWQMQKYKRADFVFSPDEEPATLVVGK